MEKNKTCCFFGHRKISGADILRKNLYKTIEDLIIYNGVENFLFGSKSDFNSLCLSVVTELKEKYPHIKRVYVRAEYPYINDIYRKQILQKYEYTYFPKRAVNAGRGVYIERNFEMIDKSDFCVVYYIEGYVPTDINARKDSAYRNQKSGTKIAYEYARKKNKTIIRVSVFDE